MQLTGESVVEAGSVATDYAVSGSHGVESSDTS